MRSFCDAEVKLAELLAGKGKESQASLTPELLQIILSTAHGLQEGVLELQLCLHPACKMPLPFAVLVPSEDACTDCGGFLPGFLHLHHAVRSMRIKEEFIGFPSQYYVGGTVRLPSSFLVFFNLPFDKEMLIDSHHQVEHVNAQLQSGKASHGVWNEHREGMEGSHHCTYSSSIARHFLAPQLRNVIHVLFGVHTVEVATH